LLIATSTEALILALVMNKIHTIRKEFSMVGELISFTALWLVLTNLALWLVIQGGYSGWF
jgi:hypothetical protein